MILGHNLACELFFIFSIPYRVYVQIIQFTVENIRRVRQRGKSMAIKGGGVVLGITVYSFGKGIAIELTDRY